MACALLCKPTLLMLADPISDLDQVNRQVVYETLEKLLGALAMLVANARR